MLISSLTRPRLRSLVLMMTVAVALLLVVAPGAEAQDIVCEKVPYNERIIIKCVTVPAGSSDTDVDTTSEPTPTPTVLVQPAADDDTDSESDTVTSDDDDQTTFDAPDGPSTEPFDRGDRGSRTGVPDVEEPTAEPSPAPTSQPADIDEPAPEASPEIASDPTENANDELASAESTETAATFDGIQSSPRGVSAPLIGIGAITLVGALFFFLARRKG